MSHQHSANCGCADAVKAADAVQSSLYPSIDLDRLSVLNACDECAAEPGNGARRCIKPWDERNDSRRLLSDEDDGEMLLTIPFVNDVHLRSIAVMAWGDWQPRKIRLFVNRDDLDLSGINDVSPAQELELAPDTGGYIDYPLKVVRFQNVHTLIIHVTEAVGGEGEQSGIQFLQLKGTSTQNKREIVNVVYESRANPADHNKLAESHQAAHGVQ